MKREILLTFLLALYIAPFILAPNYYSVAILEEPNKAKEFSAASAWLSGWEKRKTITITGVAGCGENYPINLTVADESEMQADYDDLRFTDNDGFTLLDYWIETYDASFCYVWVEVKDNLDTNQIIYMYYGNDAVSDLSDADDVFYFYDGFEGVVNFAKWDTVGAVWSVVGLGITHRYGVWSAFGDSDSTDRALKKTVNITWDVCFHSWVYIEDSVAVGANCYIWHSPEGYIAFTDSDDVAYYNGTDYLYAENVLATGTWYEFELKVDISTQQGTFYLDGVEKNTMTLAWSSITELRVITDATTDIDFYIDDYYVRYYNGAGEPTSSFGAATDQPSQEWVLVDEHGIIFYIDIDSTALEWLLVFAGLIMLPISGVYLAVNVKNKKMDSDKLFYFCVIFLFGVALFIGGIM